MTTAAIKICGITTPDALEAAIAAHADYVGFVFCPPSPRHLVPAQAAALSERASSRIATVGVFVDPDESAIAEALGATQLCALQLHNTAPLRRAQLRQQFGVPVWAAVAVRSAADIEAGLAGEDDRVLFDAKVPEGAAIPGGMGLRFDWSLLAGRRIGRAWGLAGGLTPENIGDALRETAAPLVDTSSGVESAPGVKDAGLIRAFCAAVRAV